MNMSELTYREDPVEKDVESVRGIVASSGFFYDEEVEVAVELVRERLSKGLASGYYFLFGMLEERVVGYACFGPIACTKFSYDLFWIAVDNSARGSGVGGGILQKVEQRVKRMGGKRIYVETSSRELYRPTHAFYRKCGYSEETVIRDFYAPGDHKVIYLKEV